MISWPIQVKWIHVFAIGFIIFPIFVLLSYFQANQRQTVTPTLEILSSIGSTHLRNKWSNVSSHEVGQHDVDFNETLLMPEATTKSTLFVVDLYEAGYVDSIDKCPNKGENITLLIAVTSAPDHFNGRAAVRETWGHFALRKDVEIVFLVGTTDDKEVTNKIDEEQRIFDDIVRGNYVDTYDNLTLKTLSMHEWIEQFCIKAKFVIKTDDDVYINVSNFLQMIKTLNPNVQAIYGRLAKKWKPVRIKSKYFISKQEFASKYFPDFATGPAYLFPTILAPKLNKAALNHSYLKLEDVFFNGIIASELGIKRVNVAKMFNRWKELRPCTLQRSLTLHPLTIAQHYEAWKALHSKC